MAARNAATTHEIRQSAGAVLLLAGAGLAFELTLTRLFSLLFQYHYVFLVVSLSVLGLGFGAGLGYFVSRARTVGRHTIGVSALVLALLFPFTAAVLANLDSGKLTAGSLFFPLVLYGLLGWINALIYARHAEHSNLLYGADLFGAAAGLVGAATLLSAFGPFSLAILLGALVGLAGLLLVPSRLTRLVSVAVTGLVAALALVNHADPFITYSPEKLASAPRDKTLIQVLQDPNAGAEIVFTQWGSFAQVDVVELNHSDERLVYTDAGAGSFMMRYDPAEGFDHLDWIRRETTYLPFESGPLDRVLIIGAGAGYDIVQARMAGATSITAVEINRAMVEATEHFADYNGDILNLPGVTTIVADGRNYVDRSDEQYDLIYLNIVYSQAASPNAAALAEANIFTTEALRSYWQRLSDQGRIAFVTHNGLEGVRLLITALGALEDDGFALPDALSHVALVMSASAVDPTVSPSVLLITRQPWSSDAAAELARSAAQRGMQPLYIPHEAEQPLAMLLDGSMTLDDYLAANTEYNIFPTSDNRPFFFHLDPGLPGPLADLLKASAILVAGYFIVVSTLQPRRPYHTWTRLDLALYFALLGMAFMLVEVPLIQQFKLLLGNPVLSLAITLGALLLGGGLGSLYGAGRALDHLPRLTMWATLGTALWVFAAGILNPVLIHYLLPASESGRLGVTALVVLPLGLLMGIPFPSGLRLANLSDPEGIPLFWGMNAVASTLGAALATAVALTAGFRLAFWLGGGLYLVAAGLIWLSWKRVLRP